MDISNTITEEDVYKSAPDICGVWFYQILNTNESIIEGIKHMFRNPPPILKHGGYIKLIHSIYNDSNKEWYKIITGEVDEKYLVEVDVGHHKYKIMSVGVSQKNYSTIGINEFLHITFEVQGNYILAPVYSLVAFNTKELEASKMCLMGMASILNVKAAFPWMCPMYMIQEFEQAMIDSQNHNTENITLN